VRSFIRKIGTGNLKGAALDILEECIGIAQKERNVTETKHQVEVHASQS